MPATPEDLGLSSPGLERARAHVAGCVERREIAGAVLLVARHDQVAQLDCIGLRDIEAGLPMEPDTIFRIASMTKPITSVGALMLVEAGRLRLDDPVSRYIPEFAEVPVFAGVEDGRAVLVTPAPPITIHHLLTHTSGITEDNPDPALAAVDDDLGDLRYALPELMRRLAAHPLAHQPGEGWRYGPSYSVLGRVIEVVAGQPLDEFFDSAIFTPLGMVDSGFFVPLDKVARLAAVYESDEGVLRRVEDPVNNEIFEGTPMLSGGGGCASTVPDYLRFARMLARRGEVDGVRLLKPATVESMTRNQLDAPLYPLDFGPRLGGYVSKGQGYGLGFGVTVDPAASVLAGSEGTYDWAGSWNTRFWIDPATELIGMFMSQHEPFAFEGIGTEYRSLVCRALID